MQRNRKWLTVLAGLLAMLMLFGMIGDGLVTCVQAASSTEIKGQLDDLGDEKDEIDAKIKDLRSQMSDNLDQMEAMVKQKDLIDQEISLLFQKENNLNEQIAAYALLIADMQEQLVESETNLQTLQEKHKARIRAMEENGELNFWYVLFHASSFMDMLDQLAMIDEIRRADARRLEELDQAAKEVAVAKEKLETEQAALQDSRQELAALQEEQEKKRAEVDALLIDMKAKADEFEAMMEESEARQEQLMDQIAKLEDDLEDARFREWLANNGNTTGGITWKTPCYYTALTSPFGYRWHPISGKWKMHNGIDLAGPKGTPIYATRAGYVQVAAFEDGGAGNYVTLNHGDGYKSIYMHMTHYIVKVGQYVQAGEVIGYMGTTGGSTGVHLHFGISYNGVWQNPVDYIKLR